MLIPQIQSSFIIDLKWLNTNKAYKIYIDYLCTINVYIWLKITHTNKSSIIYKDYLNPIIVYIWLKITRTQWIFYNWYKTTQNTIIVYIWLNITYYCCSKNKQINQCNQSGLFLNSLEKKILTKVAEILGTFLVYLKNVTFE